MVLAANRAFRFPDGTRGTKYTLARWSSAEADFSALQGQLCAREPGWGGQAGIIGSPQFRPSRLSLGELAAMLRAVLREGEDDA